jgi:ATP dependent DNA ligase domain
VSFRVVDKTEHEATVHCEMPRLRRSHIARDRGSNKSTGVFLSGTRCGGRTVTRAPPDCNSVNDWTQRRFCLQPDGRSHFYNLMFRREWPHFMAFDLVYLNGEDLRDLPLYQRKRRLARIMPRVLSRVRLVEQIEGCGVDFFKVACQHDLEGIVAKWAPGTYQTTGRTSWVKIRNPHYSQWIGRRELFEARREKPGPLMKTELALI